VRAADGEPTWPYPPRYWWLKRVSLGALLTGLVLAGAWEAWQRQALRRLRVETDAIVAAGDPVTAADLNPPPVPDSQNGALLRHPR